MRRRTADLHFGLARVLSAIGWSRAAAAAYADALALRPHWAEAHLERGEALARGGDWAEAAVAFESAVRLQPGSTESRGNLAVALNRAGRTADAVAALEALARHRPHDAEVHLALGSLYQTARRHDDAVRAFRWAVKLPPPPPHHRCTLGSALLGEATWSEVRAAYDHAVASAGSAPAAPVPAWHSSLNHHPARTPREFRRTAPYRAAPQPSRGAMVGTAVRAPLRILGVAVRSPRLLYHFFSTLPSTLDGRRARPASVRTFPAARKPSS
jgi:tetratricopeptide (TPR) repeat protein